MNTPLLNNIAFDIVKDKVIEDKMKEMTEEANKENTEEQIETEADRLKNEELRDIDDIDSEEERIMQKEMERRKELMDRAIEKQKKRALLKYGDYREIIETEFLDTMLKNQAVVCHFYHNDFERCKIIDKHLKEIAALHPETLFVRINADKTPFFTTKLVIKVSHYSLFSRSFLQLFYSRMVKHMIASLDLRKLECKTVSQRLT